MFRDWLDWNRAVGAALEGAKLDDTFTFREKTMSVRWMWQHLVEELDDRHYGSTLPISILRLIRPGIIYFHIAVLFPVNVVAGE